MLENPQIYIFASKFKFFFNQNLDFVLGHTLPVLPPPPHLEGRRWSARELITAMERSNCRAPSYPDELADFLDVPVSSAADLAALLARVLEVANGSVPCSPWTSASVVRSTSATRNRSSSPKRDFIVRTATPPPRPARGERARQQLEEQHRRLEGVEEKFPQRRFSGI